ncbi:MAG: hypothetical protein NWQ54_14735 [Paraglaciecola sp.]|uniref:hypothetical protein n=1 Tax=Flavobacterium sp. W21_SRS_FM6 TaxID=3240268 RepID=UPI00276924DF|nr:hypothetical protein [Paraglaciecola sp.]
MQKKLALHNSFDWLMALLSCVGAVAVLQTFIIGKHYIIPTVILVLTVLFGNLAWFGLHKRKWANLVNFWIGFLLTAHCFFALFWSVKYRAILGDQFELVFVPLTLVLCGLTWLYANHNRLFEQPR